VVDGPTTFCLFFGFGLDAAAAYNRRIEAV